MTSSDTSFSFPDPLILQNGRPVKTPSDWKTVRRPEILELFRQHVYGREPQAALSPDVSFDLFDEDRAALGGTAVRKQIAITVSSNGRTHRFDLLIYLPSNAKQPVPLFAILNFSGNHTVHPDPAIALPRGALRPKDKDLKRGESMSRYPIEMILAAGYGFATVGYCDIDPDWKDGYPLGVRALYDPSGDRARDAWGAVGAWAWGLSRILDYFETDMSIDSSRVAAAGHSRLGKTALWAAAQDTRFALAVSNNSGCTSAAVSRGKQGETVKAINDQFPHWFCDRYKDYNDREDSLPVDQHLLIASLAPRPVYVASATEDLWADPRAEFDACVRATPVFRLLGLNGLPSDRFPLPEQPINGGHIGYHLRTGEHRLTEYDWRNYIAFADRFFGDE